MKRKKPFLEVLSDNNTAISNDSRSVVRHPATTGRRSLVSYDEEEENEYSSDFDYSASQSPWRTCVDENTGYTYYWNIETNERSWENPNEIHPLTIHRIARTTQEVVANRGLAHAANKKPISDMKTSKPDRTTSNEYGPTWEDDGSQEAESRKLIAAKQRLLSYKTDLEKQKSDIMNKAPPPPSICNRLPFVPTPHEIKEHPIFSSYENQLSASTRGCTTKNDDEEEKRKPLLPKGYFKMERRASDPNNDWDDSTSGFENYLKNVDNMRLNSVDQEKLVESSKQTPVEKLNSDSDSDEEMDKDIISRLRNKVFQLKQLGGDVPPQLQSVFDEHKSAKDIMEEMARQMDSDDVECVNMDIDTDENKADNMSGLHVTPALFPSTSREVRFKDTRRSSRPLVNRKIKLLNFQKVKLSARAKELIKTSFLTAKARATNFVETADGLKPVEEVLRIKTENEEKTEDILSMSSHSSGVDNSKEVTDTMREKLEELRTFKTEIDNLSVESHTPKSCKNESDLDSRTLSLNSGASNKPVEKSQYESKLEEDMYRFHNSFIVPNKKRKKSANEEADPKNISLVSKCDEFLQSVNTALSENCAIAPGAKKLKVIKDERKETIKSYSIEENSSNYEEVERNVTDFSQLIMEKLKFLSQGKNEVTNVQVMAIQIEILINAWQSKSLSLKYLQDWLDGSMVQLKNIEDAAAPVGWQCEWDRSYGRYYYRNKDSGVIQWDFPDTDEISEVRPSKSFKRPKTPPPPNISERMVPPPPPIISDRDSRKLRLNELDEKRHVAGTSNRIETLPSLTATEHPPPLPPAPPLPPPPPSPPPLPIRESNEFGVSVQITNFDKFTSQVTIEEPINVKQESLDIPFEGYVVKSDQPEFHDQLSSFYSDIATIEATGSETIANDVAQSEPPVIPLNFHYEKMSFKEEPGSPSRTNDNSNKKKKRKKMKLDSSLSLKKKGLTGLVAKWQKASSDM